jgi:hypothetical protein
VDWIIKDVPLEGGGTGVVAAGEIVGVVTNGWSAHFEVITLVWESAYKSK